MIFLTLNKGVRIANNRLQCLYICLMLSIISLCVYEIVEVKAGTSKALNAPHLQVAIESQSINRAVEYNASGDPRCKIAAGWQSRPVHNKSGFPIFDPLRTLREQFSCTHLSTTTCKHKGCTDVMETGSPLAPVDFKLHISEQVMALGPNATIMKESGPLNLQDTEAAVQTRYNVFTQAYKFEFDYNFKVQQGTPRFLWFNHNVMRSGTSKDARTVLLDHEGVPVRVFERDEVIEVAAPELLHYSRYSRDKQVTAKGHLFSQEGYFAEHTGDDKSFPSWVWGTGATIHAEVNCFSDDGDIRDVFQARADRDHDSSEWTFHATPSSPVCVLQASLRMAESFAVSLLAKEPGAVTRRTSISIRVQCGIGTSYFRVVEFTAVIAFITSTAVLLAMPLHLMRFILLFGLGHLSSIYKAALVQYFDMRFYCAKAVVDAVSKSMCFVDLADGPGPQGEIQGGVSSKRLLDCTRNILRYQNDLDDNQVQVLVDVAFKSALSSPPQSWLRVFSLCPSKSVDEEKLDQTALLDINQFCRMTDNESLGLTAVVKLFDKDRRRGFAERVFTPVALSKRIHDSRLSIASIGSDQNSSPTNAQSDQVGCVNTTGTSTSGSSSTAQPQRSLVPQALSNLEEEIKDLRFQFSQFHAELANLRSDLRDRNQGKGSATSSLVTDTAVSTLSDELRDVKSQIAEFHASLIHLRSAREELNASQGLHMKSSAADSVVSKLSDEMCELKAQFHKLHAEQKGRCFANNDSISGSAEGLGTAIAADKQKRQQQQIFDVDAYTPKANSVLVELKDWMKTLNALHVELAEHDWSATTQSLKPASISSPSGREGQHQHSVSQTKPTWSVGRSPSISASGASNTIVSKQYDDLLAACSMQAQRIQHLESRVLQHGKQLPNSQVPESGRR